jgi:hypothetical protein
MKPRKLLPAALLVLVGAAMSFAGPASATQITSPEGTLYTGPVAAVNENGPVVLSQGNETFTTIECSSKLEGPELSHGLAVTARIFLKKLEFSACSNEFVVHVWNPGSLIVHGVGNGNGTVTWAGAEIELTGKTVLGSYTCAYAIKEVDLGLITGSINIVSPATMDVRAIFARTGGAFRCGSAMVWEGSYVFTTPKNLKVD